MPPHNVASHSPAGAGSDGPVERAKESLKKFVELHNIPESHGLAHCLTVSS